jgi:hypothetical protein
MIRVSLLMLIAAAMLVPALYIALGQYAYPSADDFCMATGVRDVGFFQHLWNHYFEWSGRYTSNAMYALYPLIFGLFDGYPLIAGLLILCLLGALAFALGALFRLSWRHPAVLLAALGILSLYLAGLRHSASSLFWMAGALSYQTSGILLLLALGLIIRVKDAAAAGAARTGYLWVLCVVILLGMGTNEINLLVMSAVMLLAAWHSLVAKQDQVAWLGLLALTLACFALVYFAPGNSVRESTFPLRHDWGRSIEGSLRMGSWSLLAWMGVPLFVVGSLLTPFAVLGLARISTRRFTLSRRLLWMLAGITLGTPLVLQFPAWWAMGGWPPPRSVDAIFFVFLLCWLTLVGALSLRFLPAQKLFADNGRATRMTQWLVAGLTCALLLSLGYNGRLNRAWQDLTESASPFHAQMMNRHRLIADARSRGEFTVVLPPLQGEAPRSIYFNDIRPNPRDWRNICYAQYFGLHSVRIDAPRGRHGGAGTGG